MRTDSGTDPRLLNDEQLARSDVVANCAMNRERQLEGPNSYARELGFHPLDWLRARRRDSGSGSGSDDSRRPVHWLDLCCGSGRALIRAAGQVRRDGETDQIAITGVDLVDYFDAVPVPGPPLRLVSADVASWAPEQDFDLITCVHGLHYIGDKLGVLTRAAGWLCDGGLLIADFDLASIRLPGSRASGRALASALREAGFVYDPRRHRITFNGGREASLPYTYLGADDQAGPGYTGQPAVHSYYEREPAQRSRHGRTADRPRRPLRVDRNPQRTERLAQGSDRPMCMTSFGLATVRAKENRIHSRPRRCHITELVGDETTELTEPAHRGTYQPSAT